MTRKSFTLRNLNSPYGSYLAYPSNGASAPGMAARADDDTRLRSDDIQLAPILTSNLIPGTPGSLVGFFDAEVRDYTSVDLSWEAPLVETIPSSIPAATRVIIVYSAFGEPPTISDGNILVDTNNTTTYTHTVPEGVWAYYTIFVKYESIAGGAFYEAAESLSVLVPKNYGSSSDLYSKIPLYYRILDGNMDFGDGGPLNKYISTIGWDIDKVRTEIDYLMTFKDPQIADGQALDYLAKDFGINLESRELGAYRLRNILGSIGTLRRAIGTVSGIETFMTALTGSNVTIDTVNHVIKVHAQRINLIKDPNIYFGLDSVFDMGSPAGAFTTSYDAGFYDTTSYPASATFDGGSASATGSVGTNPNAKWAIAYGTTTSLLLTTNADVKVSFGDTFYFSVQDSSTVSAQAAITKVGLYTSGDTPVVEDSAPKTIGSTKYWKFVIPSSVSANTPVLLGITYQNALITDPATAFRRMLLERFINGQYFDGDTVLGGWLVSGSNVSDYRWYDSARPDATQDTLRNNSFSVYNANYQKTKVVANRLLMDILPITQLSTSATQYSNQTSIPSPLWSIRFNYIPGDT